MEIMQVRELYSGKFFNYIYSKSIIYTKHLNYIYRPEHDGNFEGYAGGQRDNGIDGGSDVFDDDIDRE